MFLILVAEAVPCSVDEEDDLENEDDDTTSHSVLLVLLDEVINLFVACWSTCLVVSCVVVTANCVICVGLIETTALKGQFDILKSGLVLVIIPELLRVGHSLVGELNSEGNKNDFNNDDDKVEDCVCATEALEATAADHEETNETDDCNKDKDDNDVNCLILELFDVLELVICEDVAANPAADSDNDENNKVNKTNDGTSHA